jgi:transketolase
MPSAPPLPSAPSTPQEPGLEDVLAELRGLLASGAITQREFEDKAFGVEDALYEIQKKRDKGKLTQAEFEAEFARLNAENPAKFKPTNKGNIRRWEAKCAEAKRKERERERQIEATRRTNEFLEGKQQPCGLKVMGYALGYACVIS